MKPKELLKEFHQLDRKTQNEIRASYKKSHPKEYYYSIRLFILYCAIGITGILGLLLRFYYSKSYGIYIYTIAFFLLVICVFLLNKSNEPFYKYLNNKLKKTKN